MLKRRFKADFLVLSLIIFAFIAIVPMQAQASGQGLSYGSWEVDGFFRNNTGVFTQDFDYANSDDPLATCRNWFRLNLNGKISKSLRLKAEVLAIYEPEYSRERGAGGTIPANYQNSFDFREMRLDWRPKMGHNIRIGKQIVNWGESLSARVGDVVNPVDARFDLGFTNLEDTRMPIWMIRGIHQISSISTSIDWIVAPYMQADRFRVSRTDAFNAGGIDADGNNWNGVADNRWTAYPNYHAFSNDGSRQLTAAEMLTVYDIGTAMGGAPSYIYVPAPSLYAGLGSMFTELPAGVPLGLPGLPTTPIAGSYLLGAPVVEYAYPGSGLSDARYGFKTSSTIFGAQTGVYFWRGHQDQGIVSTPPLERQIDPATGLYTNTYLYEYTRQNSYGFYANKNFDFGVMRCDVVYRPDVRFQSTNFVKNPDGIVELDMVKAQIGYNKDFLFTPLNENQTFGFIAEYVGTFILDSDTDRAVQAFPFTIRQPRDDHQIMLQLATNYNFGMYFLSTTVIYDFHKNGLFQPSFTYNPDWMNRKWSFKLQYNHIFYDDKFDHGYAVAHEKNSVILTTQFSFP